MEGQGLGGVPLRQAERREYDMKNFGEIPAERPRFSDYAEPWYMFPNSKNV